MSEQIKSGLNSLGGAENMDSPAHVKVPSDEVTELRLRMAEIQKEIDCRREILSFRLETFEPFRQDVTNKFDSIQWTWSALKVAVPIFLGVVSFFGYFKLEAIEQIARKRAEEKIDWVADVAARLNIGDKSPAEAAELLQRAFESPSMDRRLDETLVLEILHNLDSAAMFEEGENFIKRLKESNGQRFNALKKAETFNNLGVMFQGRAFDKRECLDDAIVQSSAVTQNRPMMVT